MKDISILIVDDDVDLLMLLERRLLKEGYAVETAASLAEAQDMLRFYTANFLLLDVNVNGEDGRKLCWQIKHGQEHRNMKVIVMSGFDASMERAALFGADDFVAKPFETEFLLYKIKSLLDLEVHDSNPD